MEKRLTYLVGLATKKKRKERKKKKKEKEDPVVPEERFGKEL